MSLCQTIIAFVIVAALAIIGALQRRRPIRSDAEEIADAEREMAEHDRELARLRELAPKDISAAEALHRLLVSDLAKTREALRGFRKRRTEQLILQFSEDEQALVAEVGSVQATIARLRLHSRAAHPAPAADGPPPPRLTFVCDNF